MRSVTCDKIDIDIEKRSEHNHGTRNYSKERKCDKKRYPKVIMNTRILKEKNILVLEWEEPVNGITIKANGRKRR